MPRQRSQLERRCSRSAAVVALLLAGYVLGGPIIHFAVSMNTLHQQASVLTASGPRMPGEILTPLLLMTLAFTLLFFFLHLTAMRTEILRRRATSLARQAALGAAR